MYILYFVYLNYTSSILMIVLHTKQENFSFSTDYNTAYHRARISIQINCATLFSASTELILPLSIIDGTVMPERLPTFRDHAPTVPLGTQQSILRSTEWLC